MLGVICLKKIIDFLNKNEKYVFAFFLIIFIISIFFFTRANIEYDSAEYYALSNYFSGKLPINQLQTDMARYRLPGYNIITTPLYYFTSIFVSPFVKTTLFIEGELSCPSNDFYPRNEIKLHQILFKNIISCNSGLLVEWTMILSLIGTSYLFFIIGLIFIRKTLIYLYGEKEILENFIIVLVLIIFSPIFIHNIYNTPMYNTLFSFGVMSIFYYYLVKSLKEKKEKDFLIAGLVLGFFSLVRMEAFVLFLLLIFFFRKNKTFSKKFVEGFICVAVIILLYNYLIFHNPFYFGLIETNVNVIGIDLGYIFDNLFNPSSGLLFWSPLFLIGLFGLLNSKNKENLTIGKISFLLILLMLIRISNFYYYGEYIDPSILVRYDVNRYIIILIPFASIGIIEFYKKIVKKIKKN